ncbi:MAG: cob(I)yrinic acid a,c-diamide adenosyltransferase [Desulfobacteraceae bacterium]|nr:MAG: cob(I)yrinic acid a,c-diamide adenosyltransferase [Desulfobacteraceae bacterium]
MKIYTQTGDQGKTSLLSGERVSKSHVRIHSYGEVDELNSVVGALLGALGAASDPLTAQLQQIQADLLDTGAWLSAASAAEALERLNPIGPAHSRRIEALIDAMEAQLPALRSFILPGGIPSAAWSHLARTVCRRAERQVMELIEHERGQGTSGDGLNGILVLLNRLSDYFFVLARFLNHQAGVADTIWQGTPPR